MKLRLTQAIPRGALAPYFDGWDTAIATYECACPECDATLQIDFSTVRTGAWKWKESFSQSEIEELSVTFGLPRERAPQPWPSLSRVACVRCKAEYIFYASFDEYRHSAFRLTARALARCET